LNAQGRFALTAFSPLLFNIALIAVMFVLLASNANAAHAAQILAAPWRRRPAAALHPAATPAVASRRRADVVHKEIRAFWQGRPA